MARRLSIYDDCNCEEQERIFIMCEKHFWSMMLHREDDTVPACIERSPILKMVFDTTTP